MAATDPDLLVTVLLEICGGPAKWEKVEQYLREKAWSYRPPSPKERRIARRSFDADPADSRFLWVDVPVVGSTWRADRGASWRVAALRKATQVVVYDRMLQPEEADRTIEPAWQAYSTGALPRVTPPRHAPAWSMVFWRLREALYRAAIRQGPYDIGTRFHGSRSAVLGLARGMTGRTDIDVRPLDGRGRPGAVQHREDALDRALALIFGPLLTALLFLDLARHAAPLGVAICCVVALAGLGVAWWTGLTLPVAGTWLRSALAMLVITALMAVIVLGLPGLRSGMTASQMLVLAGTAYYAIGLVLLGRRWKWQVLTAGVVPVLVTLAVAALPLTSHSLYDAYADELSLEPGETSVSGLWQLAATVRLLWPSLGVLLFIAAGWGILRHFHFIRPGSVSAAVMAALAVVAAVTLTALTTLQSPGAAADRLKQAAVQGTTPPAYFGLTPEWACVAPVVRADQLTEKGGTLSPQRPYISFGVTDDEVVLWNRATSAPLRIAADQVRLTPQPNGAHRCGASGSAAIGRASSR
ncbi:hypothetical protein [Streptomyces sp. CL12]|uniref:hypothetical protein n=1 Tax=Streptomyces sp. CL12 TaxID=3391744 RepID=UPI003A812436